MINVRWSWVSYRECFSVALGVQLCETARVFFVLYRIYVDNAPGSRSWSSWPCARRHRSSGKSPVRRILTTPLFSVVTTSYNLGQFIPAIYVTGLWWVG